MKDKNTKGRIKSILSYKKPQFWIILVGLIIIIVVGVGLLTNPKGDEKLIGANEAIENVAREFIDDVIAIHEEPENAWRDYKIIDSKITKLDKIVVLDNILDFPIEVWNLEFRLKPDDISKASYKTTVYEEDGWFTEDNGMGRRCLVILMDENNTRLLGSFQPEEFDFDNLAKQEIRVRVMLAHMDLLPNGAYEGNHVVIKFPLSTDENAVLFLSQPAIQGDKGIWAVERWKDNLGFIHHEFPGIDIRRTDVRIDERYKELQEGFNKGEDLFLGDPIEVAMSFIDSTLRQYYLRQIQVDVTDFVVIDPATMEDFVARDNR